MAAAGRTTMLWLTLAALSAGSAAAQESPDYYRGHRARLLEQLDQRSAAIIPGAREEELEAFRQSNNFFYLTGIEQPELLLLLAPSHRSREVLFLPARNLAEGSMSEAWTGAKLGPGKQTEEQTGLARAADLATFPAELATLAGELDRLYFDYAPTPLDAPVSGQEKLLNEIREKYPHLQVLPLSRLADSLRKVKDQRELATLERAVEITGQALVEAIGQIRPGMHEYEVEAAIEYGFHRRGSQRPGFPSIVGSGPNSTVLHYNANRRRIEAGDLVLMDVGAELDYYTADITRTVPAGGSFSPRQREVYEVVLRAQQAAFAAIRPGVTIIEVHQAARQVIEQAGFGEFFIHYIGHYLGMDVHDVGKRTDQLQPGMVITVEPGIYLPAEGLGVRIEDNVVVTAEGCRVLSSAIPKTVEEIERLMRRR